MDDFADIRLHGTLPLTLDPATGALRFGLPGRDLPSAFVTGPEDLPEARIELLAFPDGRTMHAWLAGFRENQPNGAETVIPDVDWPWFLLLVRHDLDPLPGDTLNEAAPLRFPTDPGMTPKSVAQKGTETFARETAKARRAAAEANVREGWKAEIAAFDGHPAMQADVTASARNANAFLSVSVSTGDILGIGPSVEITRTGHGGYLARWRWIPLGRESEAERAVRDELAKDNGVERDGSRFSLFMPSLDRAWLDRLHRAASDVDNAKEAAPPAPR